MSRMLPVSTAAISTATAAPRGPPWGPPPPIREMICQAMKTRKSRPTMVKGRAFFAQSLFQRVFQLTLAKSDLARS